MKKKANILPGTRLTVETCIALACEFWDISEKIILKKCRLTEVVQARVSITYVMKAQGQTHRQIGRKFGKDHSSVGHYKGLILTDKFTQGNLKTFINWCNDTHRVKLPGLDIWISEFSENES